MRSPIPPHKLMVPVELEPGLTAYECPVSGGRWIPAVSYWKWMAVHPHGDKPATIQIKETTPVHDSGIRICPETGRLMVRYRVGKELGFSIDRSPTGGVWLDQGEWEALRAHGLHDHIHQIFTEPWQREAREESLKKILRESFRNRLGQEAYDKVAAFKSWMNEQPHPRDILTFLHDEEL